jgi:hypothetical protein
MLDKKSNDEKLFLNGINDFLNNRLLDSLCDYELKIYQARIDRTKTKEQRYFNSTPIRNAFASLMIVAACNNKYFTITEIVNHLRTNRQSVSTMVDECKKEGWVDVTKIGNKLHCTASETLINSFQDYINFSQNISKEFFKNLELLRLKKSISNDFL